MLAIGTIHVTTSILLKQPRALPVVTAIAPPWVTEDTVRTLLASIQAEFYTLTIRNDWDGTHVQLRMSEDAAKMINVVTQNFNVHAATTFYQHFE